MGLLDKFKKNKGDVIDKARDAVEDHAEQIDKGIDKAAEVIDDKTGGKHTDKIDKVADKAHGIVDKIEKDK